MLRQLFLKNIVLIETLSLEFDHGLSVFTGETGAGKSIILNALQLLAGKRSGKDLIRDGHDKATVEGLFSFRKIDNTFSTSLQSWFETYPLSDDNELLVHRTFTSKGKNHITINGQLATCDILQQFIKELFIFTSQHDQYQLFEPQKQLEWLDRFSQSSDLALQVYQLNHTIQNILKQIQESAQKVQEQTIRKDYLLFQIKEISEADPKHDELDLLENDFSRASERDNIIQSIESSAEILSGTKQSAQSFLYQCMKTLSKISHLDPKFQEWEKQLDSLHISVQDLAESMKQYLYQFESIDSDHLQAMTERIDQLKFLEKKYHLPLNDIITLKEQYSAELLSFDHTDETIENLKKELSERIELLKNLAKQLSEKRKKEAKQLSTLLAKELEELGMKGASFHVSFEDATQKIQLENTSYTIPSSSGNERILFLFSANPKISSKPLQKVASGGEISRVFLALQKCVHLNQNSCTMIFDEIDAGIGGETGSLIAHKLANLGKNCQVIAVSHLPQIASAAHEQYLVSKHLDTSRGAIVNVKTLSTNEREAEIARMLGGLSQSESARAHAKELLQKNFLS